MKVEPSAIYGIRKNIVPRLKPLPRSDPPSNIVPLEIRIETIETLGLYLGNMVLSKWHTVSKTK